MIGTKWRQLDVREELILQLYFLKYYQDAFVASISTVKNLFSDVWGCPPSEKARAFPQLHSLHYCTWVLRMKKIGFQLALTRDRKNSSSAQSAAQPKGNSLSQEQSWLCPPAVCPSPLLKVPIPASCKNSLAA